MNIKQRWKGEAHGLFLCGKIMGWKQEKWLDVAEILSWVKRNYAMNSAVSISYTGVTVKGICMSLDKYCIKKHPVWPPRCSAPFEPMGSSTVANWSECEATPLRAGGGRHRRCPASLTMGGWGTDPCWPADREGLVCGLYSLLIILITVGGDATWIQIAKRRKFNFVHGGSWVGWGNSVKKLIYQWKCQKKLQLWFCICLDCKIGKQAHLSCQTKLIREKHMVK